MDCESCGVAVTGLLERSGGRSVRVSVLDGKAQVELVREAHRANVLDELSGAGYPSEAVEQ
jgi:hypothetical protein